MVISLFGFQKQREVETRGKDFRTVARVAPSLSEVCVFD
jgi:hypothetical protein